MAMSTSGAGGGVASSPNVTPMIDVMLVLLIIFMIVTPLINAGFQAQPPDRRQPEVASRRQRRSGARHRCVRAVLPEQEADQERDARGSAQADLRCAHRRTRFLYVKADKNLEVLQGARRDRHRRAQRSARARRRSRISSRGPSRPLPAISCPTPTQEAVGGSRHGNDQAGGNTRSFERHQRHADDRRAAGAADHLHDGGADDPEGDRSAAARSDSAAERRCSRRPIRSCCRCCRTVRTRSTARR